MSLMEPRCLVCGTLLDAGKGSPFEESGRNSETCSDKCWEIYSFDEDAALEQAEKVGL